MEINASLCMIVCVILLVSLNINEFIPVLQAVIAKLMSMNATRIPV